MVQMSPRLSVAVVALIPALLVVAAPAPGRGQQDRFSDVTEVVVVEVPVQVLKNGEPVRGLTVDDFQVTTGRKKQKITGFDVVDLTMVDAAGEPVEIESTAARRHFLFFFDLSFSQPGSIVQARQAAIELVENGFHPSDVAAVGSYSRSVGSRLVLGFTPDKEQIKLAINTLGLPQLVESRRDPLGLVFSDLEAAVAVSERPASGGLGGNNSDMVDAEIRAILTAMERSTRTATDTNDILDLTSSMTGMATMMKSVTGRKHVIFLSEGFDSSLLLGVSGTSAEEQRQIQETNEASMRGEVWEVKSDERFGNTNMQNQLSLMLEEFVRADCTIQAVDIAGLRSSTDVQTSRGRTEDSLFIMANDTGGEFYYNFNNLHAAMGKMLERTSVTYVLAFQPENLKLDGRFHRLKVQLKGGPKGARLVHRPGYYAPRPYGEMNKIERQMAGASAIIGAPGGDVDTDVLATPFPASGESAYVPVLIEVDGGMLMAGTAGNILPTEIYTYAITTEGRVQDFFVQTLGLDLSQVGAALQQSGFKYWGHFDLPPGDYNIRVLVRNTETGASGVGVFPMTVPDLSLDEALLLPPLFPEPEGKWLLGREDQTRAGDNPYPFMIRDVPYIPAARPTVRAGQRTEVSLVGYNLGAEIPEVSAALFDSDGTRMGDVEIVLEEQEWGDDASMTRFAGSCHIPEMNEGVYKLEVTLANPETGGQTTSAIDVRVVG